MRKPHKKKEALFWENNFNVEIFLEKINKNSLLVNG
jgi:hypothetical protein